MTTTSEIVPVAAPPSDVAPSLSVRGLTKRFTDVLAADALDLDFYRGEVHAVLGENGAGKSTLMKMLYGYYHPTSGEILLDGRRVTFDSPAVARRHGIGMVFQNFTLVPALTALENIALMEPSRALRFDRAALKRRILALAATYGLEVNPDAYVRDLSVGERQRVEILKLLAGNATILILDEPTSVLAPHEVDGLLAVLARLRDDGYTVILITHKLREVFAVADRITVLRRGRVVGSGLAGGFDDHGLVQMMVGEREGALAIVDLPPNELGPAILRLTGVTVRRDDGREALHDVSLEARAGEIVGVAAVSGNGQAELAEVALGAAQLTRGRVELDGADVTRRSTADRLRAGLAVIPEDLFAMGVVGSMSVRENLMLGPAEFDGKGRFLLRPGRLARTAGRMAEESPFALPAGGRLAGTLSGGNAQRVVITRELRDGARCLIAYHPSRGLDVMSTRSVHRMLVEARRGSCAVLLISEDLDELQALSDRIVVLYHGRIAATFTRDAFDTVRIGHVMTGADAA
jgi:ABC-type uncharacterized transport system ATPase subunit